MRLRASPVVRVKLGRHEAQRGEPTRHVADIAHLAGRESAAEQRALAVGEPLLEHLIAADGEAPDRVRHIAPEGVGVEKHVVRTRAEQCRARRCLCLVGRILAAGDPAPAGHNRPILAGMAPAGSNGPISLAHRAAASLHWQSDGAKDWVDIACGDAGNRGLGIEQGGDTRAERGGGTEQLGRTGQRHARPILADAGFVLGEPRGGVADSKRMHPGLGGGVAVGVGITKAKGGEPSADGRGKIGARLAIQKANNGDIIGVPAQRVIVAEQRRPVERDALRVSHRRRAYS